MTLTIDIGNTNITFGIFEGDDLTLVSRLATERNRTGDQYALEFINIFKMNEITAADLKGAVIGSVVPELNRAIEQAIQKICGFSPLILAPGIKTGLNILTDDPAELGADLAAGGVGASERYPLPAFVVDLGTATKIYVVDKNKAYRGVMIAPGIEVSMKALTNGTSLLPSISLRAPTKACGTNTIEALQSGIIFGTADMIDGMLNRFEKEYGKPETIIATGGLSPYISDVCGHNMICDANLILYGLKSIFDRNTRRL